VARPTRALFPAGGPVILSGVEETAYQVKLPIFEGPLDLLLHLLRRNEVDIYDIPIATITGQYLEYLELMKQLNIEVAGEFLVMAATLLHIKSRLLLPSAGPDEEAEDPRLELARPLLEYIQYREAAAKLDQRPWLERDVFVRGRNDEIARPESEPALFNLGLFELLEAFKGILENLSQRQSLAVRVDRVSVRARMGELMDLFRQKSELIFVELFQGDCTRAQVVVTFLALLEIVRLGFLYIYQETVFGPIRLSVRREAFRLEEG